MKDYKLSCPAATHRLLVIGVPATVEFGNVEKTMDSRLVAETVSHLRKKIVIFRFNISLLQWML